MIRRGDLVEFTDEYQVSYDIGDPELARYGVAVEDELCSGNNILVETTKGVESVSLSNIQACSWVGWVPEEIEEILERYNK